MVALDDRDGEDFILYESDDLVWYESDDLVWTDSYCNAASGCGMKHCFVKQEAINMFSEKCPILYNPQVEAAQQSAIHGGTRTCTREDKYR